MGLSLAIASIASGLFALLIFRLTTDRVALRRTIKRIQAHFLEFRLFFDEPRMIWRAQKAIVRENTRLLLLIARPVLILTLPMAWLLVQFESVYGYAPLPVGEPSVITAQMSLPATPEDVVSLEMPEGISVETAPVRSLADGQISWRIRPLRPARGKMRLGFRGVSIEKSIAAGSRPIFLVRKRVSSWLEFLLSPEEARLPAGGVRWVEVAYPPEDVSIAGLALPWIAWFVLISFAAMALAGWLRIL